MYYSIEPVAKINLNNILSNVRIIKEKLGQPYRLCAVVKADAYGHGLIKIAEFVDSSVDMFAVARISEALALTESNITKPVLLLGKCDKDAVDVLVRRNVRISINEVDDLHFLERIDKNQKAYIHIKINSGMNRYGIQTPEELKYCLNFIKNIDHCQTEGLYSHYATADGDIDYFDKQTQLFDMLSKNIKVKFRHISATDAVMSKSSFAGNMARIGIGMYGYAGGVKLHPAMSLECGISGLYDYYKGAPLGYGNAYVLKRDSKIAVACIGYGDGLPRLVNAGKVKINGRLCSIVGRVCMDACMIDVTGCEVKKNDKIIIFDESFGADNLAQSANTITYDILTAITHRVARQYIF